MPSPFITAVAIEERFGAFNLQLKPLAATPSGSLPSPSSTSSRDGFLFRAASDSPTDIIEQRRLHALYRSFIYSMTFAIQSAFDGWLREARLGDVKIFQGGIASGGQLYGPDLYGLMVAAAPDTVNLWPVGRAIAKGLSNVWSKFQVSIRVPGLVWYPPPTDIGNRNFPTPIRSLFQNVGILSDQPLKIHMERELKTDVLFSDNLFTSFAVELGLAFDLWLGVHIVESVSIFAGQGVRDPKSGVLIPGTFEGTAAGPLQ